MNLKLLLFLAWKFFTGFFTGRSGGKQIRGAIIGLAISFIPVILVIIVADGMIIGITQRYLETSSYHAQLYPSVDYSPQDLEVLRSKPGVTGVFPERQGFGLIYQDQNRMGITIRGVSPDFLEDPGLKRYLNVVEGEAQLASPNTILLGQAVAGNLEVSVGDEVKVLTARTIRGRYLPRVSTFTVGGIVSVGYQDLDGLWVFTSLDKAKSIIPGREYSTFLGVKVEDPYQGVESQARGWVQDLDNSYRVFDWRTLNRAQYQNFEATRMLLLVIMVFIIFVSAFNLASTLLMVGLERQKELAILKSMGASAGDVGIVFLFLGAMTGVGGTLLGGIIGLAIGVNVNGLISLLDKLMSSIGWIWNSLRGLPAAEFTPILNSAYYLEEIPIIIEPSFLLYLGGIAVFLAIVFSAWPAYRAARLKPLGILRKVG
jgi:lipoprotein-releasing system permease protein